MEDAEAKTGSSEGAGELALRALCAAGNSAWLYGTGGVRKLAEPLKEALQFPMVIQRAQAPSTLEGLLGRPG